MGYWQSVNQGEYRRLTACKQAKRHIRLAISTRLLKYLTWQMSAIRAKQAWQHQQGIDVLQPGQIGIVFVHDPFYGQAVAINGLLEEVSGRQTYNYAI